MTGFDALCWAGTALLGTLTLGCLLCGLLIAFVAVQDIRKRRDQFIRDLEHK